MEPDLLDPKLRFASASAGALLVLLCVLTVVTGTSQQWFEWAHAPDVYAAALVAHAASLRAIVAVDDVFIAAYVAGTVLFATKLRAHDRSALPLLVLGLGFFAGLLDLEENHHLLALARLAERGVAIPLDAILHRTTTSQLKWMAGHLAFVFGGLSLVPRTSFERVFRATLLAVQLPIGALVFAVELEPYRTVLVWARYASLSAGFLTIAWLSRPRALVRDDDVGVARGVPA